MIAAIIAAADGAFSLIIYYCSYALCRRLIAALHADMLLRAILFFTPRRY